MKQKEKVPVRWSRVLNMLTLAAFIMALFCLLASCNTVSDNGCILVNDSDLRRIGSRMDESLRSNVESEVSEYIDS